MPWLVADSHTCMCPIHYAGKLTEKDTALARNGAAIRLGGLAKVRWESLSTARLAFASEIPSVPFIWIAHERQAFELFIPSPFCFCVSLLCVERERLQFAPQSRTMELRKTLVVAGVS
jgi:hypothetical protein